MVFFGSCQRDLVLSVQADSGGFKQVVEEETLFEIQTQTGPDLLGRLSHENCE